MNWNSELTIYYVVFFVGALAFSFLVNGLLLRFVQTLGVRNLEESNQIRWSEESKPSLGGIGFYLMFLISFTALSIIPIEGVSLLSTKSLGLFLACTLGFFIGLADDAYNTRPLLKFLGQLLCANILIVSGIYITVSGSLAFNYIFTILWVVGLMNSLNMLDNMDGITASVSVAAIAGGLLIVMSGGIYGPYGVILLGMLAALLGFLWYNWNPSKMYMGDTGSQFIGVFLAAMGILLFWGVRNPTTELIQIKQFVIPLLMFLMPIVDTTTVFIRRIVRGQSPFVGGKDHTTHQFAFLGLKDRGVALLFMVLALASMLLGWIAYKNQDAWTFQSSLIVIGGFILFFTLVQLLYQAGKKKHDIHDALILDEEIEREAIRLRFLNETRTENNGMLNKTQETEHLSHTSESDLDDAKTVNA